MRSEHQPEQADLDPLRRPGDDAREPVERSLHAAPRGGGDEPVAEEVLPDRGRREVEPELRHRPPQEGGEGVGVRSGPDPVAAGVRVGAGGPVEARDERVHPFAAQVDEELRLAPEPAGVGVALVDHERSGVPAKPPADHLVHGEGGRAARLDRHPGVHPEVAAPAPGAGRVHLHHRLGHRGRIGGEPDRLAARGAPFGGGPCVPGAVRAEQPGECQRHPERHLLPAGHPGGGEAAASRARRVRVRETTAPDPGRRREAAERRTRGKRRLRVSRTPSAPWSRTHRG